MKNRPRTYKVSFTSVSTGWGLETCSEDFWLPFFIKVKRMIQIIHILAFINVLLIHGVIVLLWYETFSWLLFTLFFWFIRFSSGFSHEGSGKDLQV